MNWLGLGVNLPGLMGNLHLEGLLKVLVPFAVVVCVWMWLTLRKGSRSVTKKEWVVSRHADGEGIPLLYDLDTEPKARQVREPRHPRAHRAG